MQDLVDLIDFIQKTKFKSNTLLEALIRPDSQMGKMYAALTQGEARSEQELLALLPELGDLSKITTLKNRLKNRLCDAVFLLDFREESFPDRQMAFVECLKKWSSAMILITKNIRSIGVKQLENLLRHTLHFEFTELSMNIIRTLELYYGTIEGDRRRYAELETQLVELEAIWLAEREIERLYADLIINYVNSRSDKHLAAQKAEEYVARAQPYIERYGAFKIHFFGYLIQTVLCDSRNDYAGMEKVCVEAIAYFDGKGYESGMVLQTFYYDLITCYLYTRQFQKGQPYVQALELMLEENSFNWFKVQELYFTLAMHTENYREAHQILLKVLANPYFTAQPGHIVEIWKIFEAYIYYLVLAGALELSAADLQPTFKISRFVNELTTLTKDKRGMNVPIQVIQFLFFIAQRKTEACEDRMEALKKYYLRYLNDESTVRSRNFIKMLLHVPLNSFHHDRVRQKTADIFSQLQQHPGDTVHQHREIEIVPYEHLWPIVLRSLDARISSTSTFHNNGKATGANPPLPPGNDDSTLASRQVRY